MAPGAAPRACLRCGSVNPQGAVFCGTCGSALPVAAPRPGWAGGLGAPLPAGPGAPSGYSSPSVPLGVPTGIPLGPSADQQATLTGLLLSAIGFALSWIPLVNVVGGLLVLIGFIYLFTGRRGFGPEHHRWVVRGSALLIAGIVGAIATVVVLSWLEFQATVASFGGSGAIGAPLANELLVLFAVLGILGALGYMARVLLVYALADRRTRLALWVGFALGIAVVAGSIAAAFFIFTPSAGAISSLGAYGSASDLIGVAGAAPAILFAWSYYHIRDQRLGRGPAFDS